MKYVLIFVFIGLITILPAYAQYLESDSDGTYPIWPPVCLGGIGMTCSETPAVNFLNKAIGDPFEKSDIVVVGKIIEAKSMPEQNITQYNVGVQYYLKNEKPHDLLNVIGEGILSKEFPGSEILVFNRPIFEKNDRVFLYLISKDGKYYLLPYSFLLDNNIPIGPPPEHAIFKNKNKYFTGEKIVISGMVQKGNLYLSVAEHHAKPEVKIRFENSTNQPFFEDIVDVKPDGTFSYVTNFSAKNAKTGSYSFSIDAGSSSTGSSFEYIAYPLKQFKSGISVDQIQCKEGFAVAIKKTNGNPNCVKHETLEKLRERGWAEPLGDIVFQRPSQTESEPAFTPHSKEPPDYHFDKTFTLIGKKSEYSLDYLMPSGTITDIQLDCNSLQLVLSVSSTKSGVLTLLLPEEIIGNIETILVDKMQWNYISYAGNTVTVMIPENTETVEIRGSYRDSIRGAECR